MRKSYNVVFGLMVAGLLGSHTATAQNQRSQDQVRPNSARMQNNQGSVTVEQAIAKKLMMANKAEIELAELAQQKSKNQQVTQFADQLASDHEQVLQKLKQWETQKEGQVDRERSSRSGNQTPRQQTGNQTEDQPNQDTGSKNPQRDRLLGQGQNQDREQQRGNRGMRNTVPQALCAIMEKASSNCQQMTKQMLQNYEGADFDMAFVGQQTIAHMTLLAELRAIEEQDLGQLSQIAGKAATTTESHLEKLKQLARELENNSTRG